jgi:L-glutamine-phosphate cytidylyltransferase
MRVVIPAAGVGSRLRPHTADRPKCLVPVGGVPIIAQTLAQLLDAGCTHVVVVAGYHADMLEDFVSDLTKRPDVSFVRNTGYATTNSMASLQASFPFWDGPVAVVDSDILVADRLLCLLLAGTDDAMVIDAERSPAEIDMAAEIRDGRVWHLDKELPPDRVGGEFFGLSRWSAAGAARLRATIDAMVDDGGAVDWYQFAIRRLAKSTPIAVLPAHREEWTEIDNPDDLRDAESDAARGAAWGRR